MINSTFQKPLGALNLVPSSLDALGPDSFRELASCFHLVVEAHELVSWRVLTLLHDDITFLEHSLLEDFSDEGHQGQLTQVGEQRVSLEHRSLEKYVLCHDIFAPDLEEVLLIEDRHFCFYLGNEPSLQRVVGLHLVLHEVEDVTLRKLGKGVRQLRVALVVFHQNRSTNDDIDLVWLEEENVHLLNHIYFYLIHELSDSLHCEPLEEVHVLHGPEDFSKLAVQPLWVGVVSAQHRVDYRLAWILKPTIELGQHLTIDVVLVSIQDLLKGLDVLQLGLPVYLQRDHHHREDLLAEVFTLIHLENLYQRLVISLALFVVSEGLVA